jgi:hypothetical protein
VKICVKGLSAVLLRGNEEKASRRYKICPGGNLADTDKSVSNAWSEAIGELKGYAENEAFVFQTSAKVSYFCPSPYDAASL